VKDHRALGLAALLAGHPAVGPRRLTELLDGPGAERGWIEVGGDPAVDGAAVVAAHRALGIAILALDDPRYPAALRADPEPPALLFATDGLSALDRQRVAIVGTRRCTGGGAGVARQLGQELTEAGVAIVSGLALGIDGAAHRGALDAAGEPIGVVGSGLDVVYPRRHRDLWERVRAAGLLLGEAPLGTRPAPWRFPARNRIIAGLSDLVIVVESHAAGGSMHTVREAADRDIQVMAVPGSVRNPAAAGPNQLIADGCSPCRDATDVLVALGLSAAARGSRADRRARPDATGKAVLAAFDWEPATLEHLVVRTGVALPDLASALERLLETGWVQCAGGWYERVAARAGVPSPRPGSTVR
jgi:DNA processing protein